MLVLDFLMMILIGARILWVESTQTGDMVPVARHISTQDIEANNNTSSVIPNEESGGDLEDARAIEEDHAPLLAIPPPPLALETTSATTATHLGGQQMNSPDLLESDSNSTAMMKSAVINRGSGFNNKQGGGDILESSITPIVAYHNMVMVQRGIFLVFQGLLAGFSFTSEFIYQSSNGDDTDFVTTYQPIAQYFRRFFYILATISLVGSLDMCLTIYNSISFQRRNRGISSSNNYNNHRAFFAMSLNYDLSSFLLSLLIGLLYATAFITTILMSQFDVLTSLKDDVSIWPEEALQDSQYSSCLNEWKGLNTARLITSVLAWMGSCLFVWKDLIQLNAKSADLLRLREVTLAWSGRVKAMEGGSGIDKLNPNELRKLIAIMKVGIDRAKDALSFFEQQQVSENISQKNK